MGRVGADYEGTDLDRPNHYDLGAMGQFPLMGGVYSELMKAKLAPCLALQAGKNLSFGGSLHLNYSTADLGEGKASDFGLGFHLGVVYALGEYLSLGATYISPQSIKYDDVADLDGDGVSDTPEMEGPQEVGGGIAYHFEP